MRGGCMQATRAATKHPATPTPHTPLQKHSRQITVLAYVVRRNGISEGVKYEP
jgi:hypothetical protein